MDSDEDLDTHICLKCQRTIVGLDNYVAHKRRECPVLLVIRAKPPDHVLISTTVNECTNDTPVRPTPTSGNVDSLETSPPVHCVNHSPTEPQHHQASRPEDAFFLSLELQSANRPTAPPNGRLGHDDPVVVTSQPLPEEAVVPVPLIPYTSDEVAVLDTFKVAADAFKAIPDTDPIYDTDEEQDDDDPDVPPRGHTGGKWRPASANEHSPPPRMTTPPVSLSVEGHCDIIDEPTVHRYNTRKTDTRYSMCSRCLNAHPPFSRHCGGLDDKSIGRVTRWLCRPCHHLTFSSEAALIQHLSSPGCQGWNCDEANRGTHVAQVLRLSTRLAPLAPFRCSICHFYFSQPEELISHWSTEQPEHQDCVAAGRPFTCSHCTNTFPNPTLLHLHLVQLLSATDRQRVRRLTPLVTDAVAPSPRRRPHRDRGCRTALNPRSVNQEDSHTASESEPNESSKPLSFKCRRCTDRFARRPSLLSHLSLVHLDSTFRCRSCCLAFARRADWVRHNGTTLHHCHSLVDPLSDEVNLSGTQESSVSCEQCSFVSRSPSSLVFHRVVQHGGPEVTDDGSELYRCPQCPADLPQELFAFRLHLMEHTDEVPRHYCSTCRLVFDDEAALLGHDRSRHRCKNLSCGRCDFRTDRNSKLVDHSAVHRTDRSRRFLCDTCGAGFYSGASLRSHLTKHFRQKTHMCTFEGCSRAFRFASELVEHGRVHQPHRPFLCDFCGYGAKTRAQLAIHRRQHTVEKRFRCPHIGCDYATTISAHLRRHRLLHTGAKPYRCPHCNYTCNTQENLRKHILKSKKHRGLHVYPCPHCAFGCNLADDMRRHLADTHDVTPTNDVEAAFASRITGVYRPDEESGTTTTSTRGAQIAFVKRDMPTGTTKRKRKQATIITTTSNSPTEKTLADVGADQVNEEVEVTTTVVALSDPLTRRDTNHAGDGEANVNASSDPAEVSSAFGQDGFVDGEQPDQDEHDAIAPTSFTVSLLNSSEFFRFVDDQQEEIVFTIELPASSSETSVQLLEIVGERITEERSATVRSVDDEATPNRDDGGHQ